MKKSKFKVYAAWILFSEAVGLLSGLLTKRGTEAFQRSVVRPPLSPPAALFPIVWTVLFALMGFGAARVHLSSPSEARTGSLRLFYLQLGFNFFWSSIFFNLENYGFAFFGICLLWSLILGMILSFRKVDKFSAQLQIPYLLWVTFAAYLNLGVCILN